MPVNTKTRSLRKALSLANIVKCEIHVDDTQYDKVLCICMDIGELFFMTGDGYSFTILRYYIDANGKEIVVPLNAGMCWTLDNLETAIKGTGVGISAEMEWSTYYTLEEIHGVEVPYRTRY